ncbi:MAG: 3'(2'),5'-bisphosphate nucleotidase CysQ [Hyphomicrobiales bacterium]|nr:3'(2'),5'-bisphosphate nucleotidase CysQ [Hyphomicrobiales bacterium]
MSAPDHRFLAEKLTATAWRAGAVIMSYFGNVEVELKDDASPVTAADRESEAVIVAELAALAPDITIISEESATTPEILPGSQFFLVDPLDGTKEFISGRGEFTVNIALIENATPVFGLVYAPARSKIFITLSSERAVSADLDALASEPVFDNITWHELGTRTPPPEGLVAAVSRSHLDEQTENFLSQHAISDTISGGSSVKFCLIAEGKADVYPRFGRTMEWDTAAGHAVLAAAGGDVLDETGKPLRYGKTDRGLDNPGFVAWGRCPRSG